MRVAPTSLATLSAVIAQRSTPSVPALPAPPAVRRLQPTSGFAGIDFRELWSFRELLFYLVWRDVKARYKQTYLGGFWAIFKPLVSMVMMSVIFGGLVGIKPGNGVPYPLFVYTGVLVWTYFSSAATNASSSLLANAGLLSKAYFPRLHAPLAAAVAPLVDFVLAFVVVLGLFAYYGVAPSWHIVFLPAFLLLALAAALVIGLWLAGLTVRYRDIPFALPFVLQVWMYATPVIYPTSLVPERFRWLIALNPLTAVVDGSRWAVLGGSPPGTLVLAASTVIVALTLVAGTLIFRRSERTFADRV